MRPIVKPETCAEGCVKARAYAKKMLLFCTPSPRPPSPPRHATPQHAGARCPSGVDCACEGACWVRLVRAPAGSARAPPQGKATTLRNSLACARVGERTRATLRRFARDILMGRGRMFCVEGLVRRQGRAWRSRPRNGCEAFTPPAGERLSAAARALLRTFDRHSFNRGRWTRIKCAGCDVGARRLP